MTIVIESGGKCMKRYKHIFQKTLRIRLLSGRKRQGPFGLALC